jgi:hypothetical protein
MYKMNILAEATGQLIIIYDDGLCDFGRLRSFVRAQKVKLSLCLTKLCVMKTSEGVHVYSYSQVFLTSALV